MSSRGRHISVLTSLVVVLVTALTCGVMAPSAQAAPGARHWPVPSWQLLPTGTTDHFRGLAPVSRAVAWLGGYNGAVLRTVDGGRSWRNVGPPGASTLQFRDVSAFDAYHAVAMAAGSGTASRLYYTADGGRSWRLSYRNADPAAFFDCMSFYDPWHGLVVSDPVGGKFRILSTADGGRSWTVLSNAGMPRALPGEAAFAASGECLTTSGRDAWFGTGGTSVSTARVFHSGDGGLTWDVRGTPIPSGPSAGIFALAFRGPLWGVAVGGDFGKPTASARVAAFSYFGLPWTLPRSQPSGYRSGLTWVPYTAATLLAVGLSGSDISYDAGQHWLRFDAGQFDTVSCASDGSCWAAGDLGRVAVLRR
jgi:photosystem II stability/assembly factor-like uncharacterized protein